MNRQTAKTPRRLARRGRNQRPLPRRSEAAKLREELSIKFIFLRETSLLRSFAVMHSTITDRSAERRGKGL